MQPTAIYLQAGSPALKQARQLQKDLPNANKRATPNPLPSPALPGGYPGWSHSLPGTIQPQTAVFMLRFEAFQLWPELLPRRGPLAREDTDECRHSACSGMISAHPGCFKFKGKEQTKVIFASFSVLIKCKEVFAGPGMKYFPL